MPVYVLTKRPATIDERFRRFLANHPEVYEEFCRIARQLLVRGIDHYGAKAIMEVIRFERAMSGQGELLNVNNNYTSRLARKLMAEDERFNGFFETRELRNKW